MKKIVWIMLLSFCAFYMSSIVYNAYEINAFDSFDHMVGISIATLITSPILFLLLILINSIIVIIIKSRAKDNMSVISFIFTIIFIASGTFLFDFYMQYKSVGMNLAMKLAIKSGLEMIFINFVPAFIINFAKLTSDIRFSKFT